MLGKERWNVFKVNVELYYVYEYELTFVAERELVSRMRCAPCNINNRFNNAYFKIMLNSTTSSVHLCNNLRQYRISCWNEWYSSTQL